MSSRCQKANADYKRGLNEELFDALMNMTTVDHAMVDLSRGHRILVELSAEPNIDRFAREFLEQQLKAVNIDMDRILWYPISIEPTGKDNDEYHVRAELSLRSVDDRYLSIIHLYRSVTISYYARYRLAVLLCTMKEITYLTTTILLTFSNIVIDISTNNYKRLHLANINGFVTIRNN